MKEQEIEETPSETPERPAETAKPKPQPKAPVAAPSAEAVANADQPRNIIFVRRSGGEAAEAPRVIRDGGTVIELPDTDTQRAGFYHPQAARLIRAFPKSYKAFVEKGRDEAAAETSKTPQEKQK